MLTSLRLKDWKSFGDGPAMPFGPLTLLVGPNGSGKSNVIDALRFLQGAALDLPLGDVLRGRYEGQREVWPGIRGHVIESARGGTGGFSFQSYWRQPTAYPHEVGHSLTVVSTTRDVLVQSEELSDSEAWRYRTRAKFLEVWGDRDTPALRRFDPGRMILSQVGAPDTVPEQMRRWLRDMIFLDVQPTRMRDYRAESASQLGINAENVSPVLYRLSQESRSELLSIVDWLSELCAPVIDHIDFDRTQLGEVMMFLVEATGARVSARSVSDGTLRFLGMVVALLTVPEGSMIVVEEPDVGLHPSRIHLLASLLEDTVKRRSLQVIATTHSPTLLSHLSAEALSNVIAFGRDPDDGTTIGRRIGDLPHFETLQKSNEMEHLVSTGWLERAL